MQLATRLTANRRRARRRGRQQARQTRPSSREYQPSRRRRLRLRVNEAAPFVQRFLTQTLSGLCFTRIVKVRFPPEPSLRRSSLSPTALRLKWST